MSTETQNNPATPLTIKDAVAARLAESGETVRENVINLLTKEEVEKRTQLVLKGVSAVDQARRELEKVSRPDLVTYDAYGVEKDSSYSKGALEAKNKAAQKLNRLETALAQALEGNNYDQLGKLVGGQQATKEASTE